MFTYAGHFLIASFVFVLPEEFAKRLPEFEVVKPALVSRNRTFLSYDLAGSSVKQEELNILFRAFGGEFFLNLRKNHELVSSEFSSAILSRVATSEPSSRPRDCYYIGVLAEEPRSSVALSNCHGLVSLILNILNHENFTQLLRGTLLAYIIRGTLLTQMNVILMIVTLSTAKNTRSQLSFDVGKTH